MAHAATGSAGRQTGAVPGHDATVLLADGDAHRLSAREPFLGVLGDLERQGLCWQTSDFSPEHGETCDDLNGEVTVLLDAEVEGVRLLALRRENRSPISLLSPREQEIARMVASGYPNKTIASVLEISSWTVASHLRRIFMKLKVSSRAAMAARLTGSALSELLLSNIDPHEPVFPAAGSRREIGT